MSCFYIVMIIHITTCSTRKINRGPNLSARSGKLSAAQIPPSLVFKGNKCDNPIFYEAVFDNGAIPGAEKLLTSVQKKVYNTIYGTNQDVISGTFTPGMAIYNLANDGVGLAPSHETDVLIPPAIKAHLEQVKNDILAGKI